MLHHKKYKA